MSNELGTQVYNLTMQNLVTLWILDFNPVINFETSGKGIIHITSYKDSGNNIYFAGRAYDYVGVQGGGFRSEINGSLPQPEVIFDKGSLNNLAQYKAIRQEFIEQTGQLFFDWRGARITRIRTTSNYLDNGSSPDSAIQDAQEFLLDRITRTTKDTISAELTVSIGADRLTNQSVQELAFNRCGLRYRDYNNGFSYIDEKAGGCPYGNPTTGSNWSNVRDFGDLYFNEDDNETNESVDMCSYSIKGCALRFDPDKQGLTLPFLGKYKSDGGA